ncbi:MAG: ABC transporter permease, partial [Promethearchaeota archaeon]
MVFLKMIQKTSNQFSLVSLKIIPLKKLRLFIIGIIVISGICSSSAAFLLGIANIQYVLGEEENVVLITAPGVTTPITSVIPIFSAPALRDCTGIEFVSPETLSISILYKESNFPVTVRGITSEYLNITNFKIKEGIDIFEPNRKDQVRNLRGAVVGRTLAQVRHLDVGDKIQLTGTLYDSTVALEIVGILEHDSQEDSEILVPLWAGQVLIGTDSDSVTLIRVQFDPTRVSKEEIQKLVDAEFNVRLRIVRGNATAVARDVEITVYDSNGKIIPSLFRTLESSESITNYSLPLGIYNFTVNEKGLLGPMISSMLLINKSTTVTLGLIGLNNYNLKVQIHLNGNPLPDANVSIHSRYLSEPLIESLTNQAGKCDLILPEQEIYISVIKGNFSYISNTFSFNRSQTYTLNLNCSLRINVVWTDNNLPIPEATVQIGSFSTDWEELQNTKLDGTCDFVLDPGNYYINITKDEYQRISNITVEESSAITMSLGYLLVNVYATNGLTGLEANITVYENSNLIDSKQTDEDGWTSFSLKAGVRYNFTAKYNQKVISRSIIADFSHSVTFNFLKALFQLKVVNATTKEPIPFCKVTVHNFDEEIDRITYTDNIGLAELITSWGMLRISAERDGVETSKNFSFNPFNNTCYLSLGRVSFNVTVNGASGTSIINFLRNSDQSNYSFSLETYNNVTLELETDTYTITFSNGSSGFYEQELYISGTNLDFQTESVSVGISVIDWNNNSNPVPNIAVKVKNKFTEHQFFNYTNEDGEIITELSPGEYEIRIEDNSETHANYIDNVITNDQDITLGVGTCHLRLSFWNSTGNETITGVNVTLVDVINGVEYQNVTDGNGLATFDIPVQEYELNATYEKDDQNFTVIQTVNSFKNSTTNEAINIGNTFVLKVGVWDTNTGFPLDNENVQISIRSEEVDLNVSSGLFLKPFFLPSNQYTLTFSYNLTTFAEHVLFLNKSMTIVKDLVHLSVIIKDQFGLGVENTTVVLINYHTNHTLFQAQTNKVGVSNFYILPSLYTIAILHADFSTQYTTMTVQFDTIFNYHIGFRLTVSCIS